MNHDCTDVKCTIWEVSVVTEQHREDHIACVQTLLMPLCILLYPAPLRQHCLPATDPLFFLEFYIIGTTP